MKPAAAQCARAASHSPELAHRGIAAASLAAGRGLRADVKNIESLIADGGDITVGAIGSIECAATAADYHNAVAMLARREGETLNALLKRLDKAIAKFYADGEITDEINGP